MRGIRFLGALVLLTGLLLGATPADAAKKDAKKGGKLVTRSATATATGQAALATATATCPKGRRAVSGGFFAQKVTSGTVLPSVYESQKIGQRSWRVSLQLVDFAAPADTVNLTAEVYCRRGAPKTSAISSTSTLNLAAGQVGPPAVATCVGGRKALAGGFQGSLPSPNPNSRLSVIESVRASATSWQATASHGSGQTSLTTFAYCAKSKKVPAEVRALGAPGPVLGPTTVAANCSGKRSAVAGGFTTNRLTTDGIIFVFESRRVGKGWQASGFYGSPPPSLGALAYCG